MYRGEIGGEAKTQGDEASYIDAEILPVTPSRFIFAPRSQEKARMQNGIAGRDNQVSCGVKLIMGYIAVSFVKQVQATGASSSVTVVRRF